MDPFKTKFQKIEKKTSFNVFTFEWLFKFQHQFWKIPVLNHKIRSSLLVPILTTVNQNNIGYYYQSIIANKNSVTRCDHIKPRTAYYQNAFGEIISVVYLIIIKYYKNKLILLAYMIAILTFTSLTIK